VRNPSSQLTDRLQTLGLSELLARARELGATFFRDRESVIKPAVQAACLEQEYDRQEARGKQAEKAAGIKADIFYSSWGTMGGGPHCAKEKGPRQPATGPQSFSGPPGEAGPGFLPSQFVTVTPSKRCQFIATRR
jgi:hypothetical protein